MSRQPTLSLCMIVRDEEAMLPACLASVRDVVDEMVVVDTGSRDSTVRLAVEAGARVLRHAWSDSFAEARNVATAACTGDWLLVLDADERLGPDAAAAIRPIMLHDALCWAQLRLHQASEVGATVRDVISGRCRLGDPLQVLRLLRKHETLVWRGRVHENVEPWFAARIRQGVAIDADIVHLGADPALRRARQKDERNLRLLERQCTEQPDDLLSLSYLALELASRGDLEQATARQGQAWTLLASLAARGVGGPWNLANLALLRIRLQLGAGLADAARLTLSQAEAWCGPHPAIFLARGLLHESQADLAPRQDRVPDLVRASQAHGRVLASRGHPCSEEVPPGLNSWMAMTRLGSVLLRLGESRAAAHAFETALAERSDTFEAKLGRAEARIGLGQAEAALEALGPLLPDPSPDAWVLSACACEFLRMGEERASCIQGARQRLGQGFVSSHRAEFLAALVAAGDPSSPEPFLVVGAEGSGGERLSAMLGAHPQAPGRAGAQAIADVPLWDLAWSLPRARFIHVVRDGREVVAGRMGEGIRGDPGRGGNPALLAQEWLATVLDIRRQLAAALGRVIEVRHEDLVADPEGQLARVLGFLGWSADKELLSRLANTDIDHGNPRNDASHAVVTSVAGELLAELGYLERGWGGTAEVHRSAMGRHS